MVLSEVHRANSETTLFRNNTLTGKDGQQKQVLCVGDQAWPEKREKKNREREREMEEKIKKREREKLISFQSLS